MFEVLQYYMPKITKSNILKKLNLKKNNYFLVSAHREENIDCKKRFTKLTSLLNSLAEEYGLPIIFSTHPRTRKRINESNIKFRSNIKLTKPFGYFDYIKLQINAKAVLSDSGTVTEESSILNFPALNIRETHERPEGMEEASVMMVDLDINNVRAGLKILKNQKKSKVRLLKIVRDYDYTNVSEKVLRIMHSYVDYINKNVWKKY
jgi:UDP-N-acetylglucosamine 2-epimerase (non-hydrolysing)